MADKKISEFTVVTDLEGTDHLTGVDNSAADADKNVIITVANFIANVLTGTTAGTLAAGNDSRLSDARTPTAHNTTHQSGGSDAIKLDDLAAPDDNTDLNATTSAHGLLPKLGGGTTNFLRADGSWAEPPSAAGWDGDIADIDLDGGTDIGADLADADLVLVDDGAAGTNRKSALSRVWTYIASKLSAAGTAKTIAGATLTQYKETTASATLTSATTLSLANGPIQRYSIDGTVPLTMPTATGGESLMLVLTNTASSTHSWASSPAITWMSEEDSGTPPSAAADTYKTSYSFVHDGAAWLGWKTGEETA